MCVLACVALQTDPTEVTVLYQPSREVFFRKRPIFYSVSASTACNNTFPNGSLFIRNYCVTERDVPAMVMTMIKSHMRLTIQISMLFQRFRSAIDNYAVGHVILLHETAKRKQTSHRRRKLCKCFSCHNNIID